MTSLNEETLAVLICQGSSSDSPRRARQMTATIADASAETTTPRERMIADLRAMADFLDAHPDVPVHHYTSARILYFPDHAPDADKSFPAALAEVEQVAKELGVEVAGTHHHRAAEFSIGRVMYGAVAINDEKAAV